MPQKEDMLALRTLFARQAAPAGGQHGPLAAFLYCCKHCLRKRCRVATHHAAEADVNGLRSCGEVFAECFGRPPLRLMEEPVAGHLGALRPVCRPRQHMSAEAVDHVRSMQRALEEVGTKLWIPRQTKLRPNDFIDRRTHHAPHHLEE